MDTTGKKNGNNKRLGEGGGREGGKSVIRTRIFFKKYESNCVTNFLNSHLS